MAQAQREDYWQEIADGSDPRRYTVVAEVASSEEDWDVAENALLEALSRVRQRKQEGSG